MQRFCIMYSKLSHTVAIPLTKYNSIFYIIDLLLRSVKIQIAHMPVSSSLQFQNVFSFTWTYFVIIKNKPVLIFFISIRNRLRS